jgi:hypothetical protein
MFARKVWPQGYDTALDAPETFRALKEEYTKRGRITVFSGASSKTIFDDHGVNLDFRAWHDWAHLQVGGKSFNVDSEAEACQLQCDMVRARYNGSDADWLCRLIDAEIMGQAKHWAKYKAFVDNQRAFDLAYIANPGQALSMNWSATALEGNAA